MDSLMTLIMGIAAVALVFIILRELFLWYWKINDIIKNQEEQIRLLRKIAGEPEEKKEE